MTSLLLGRGVLCSCLGGRSAGGFRRFGFHRDHAGLGTPDLVSILLDGTVTGELADIGYVVDDHLQPFPAVLVHLRHPLLACNVGLVVGKQAVPGALKCHVHMQVGTT